METKLTLKQIYMKALAEGLTSKEAAFKYNCNYRSLLTRGSENGLPPLKSHWRWTDQRELNKIPTYSLLQMKEQVKQHLTQIENAIQEKQQQTACVN
jgi:hypothetical protein